MKHKLFQAYRQTPWRQQIQWISWIFVAFITLGIVFAIALTITGEERAASLTTLSLDEDKGRLEREIPDLRARLAYLTSAQVMEQRALPLGFKPVKPESIVYMVIPGYQGRTAADVPLNPTRAELFAERIIKPSYKESLWEWFYQSFFFNDQTPGEKKP